MKLELLSSNQERPVEFISGQAEVSEVKQNRSMELYSDVFGFGTKTNAEKNASEKTMNEIVKKVNKTISATDTKLEISVFKPTHELQIKIKDNKTGKVIREIPSEKMLELGVYMRRLSGIIVDEKI